MAGEQYPGKIAHSPRVSYSGCFSKAILRHSKQGKFPAKVKAFPVKELPRQAHAGPGRPLHIPSFLSRHGLPPRKESTVQSLRTQ